MGICANRPEGFGPKSHLSAPLPTTCFTDTILLPLPIFILPILIALTFAITRKIYNPSTKHLRAKPLSRTCGYTTCIAIYYILVAANILMEVLEIVRLSLIKFGIGLLPFVIIGLLVGGVFHYTHGLGDRIWMWQAINISVWAGGMVFSIIKTVGLVYEGVEERKGTKYPMEDQITDTGVMAGVYAVLVVLESVLWWWQEKRRSREEESLGSGTPVLEGGRFGFGEEFGNFQEMK